MLLLIVRNPDLPLPNVVKVRRSIQLTIDNARQIEEIKATTKLLILYPTQIVIT